jgi:rRNA small subunit pseudouridine methyltransferase Nep1
MLKLLIADAELELIPREMLDDYSIRLHAKKRKKPPQKILLDSNYMHSAIDRFFPGESNRRGRPDIIYHLLAIVMESILNKKGGMRIWIHTRNNLILEISPETRLPKSYNRFVGLMEDLFEKGEIKYEEKTLLRIHNGDVAKMINLSESGNIKVLSPVGKMTQVPELLDSENENISFLIGGFSEGDFISDVYEIGEAFSIFDEELTIWSVAMEIIAQYERTFRFV